MCNLLLLVAVLYQNTQTNENNPMGNRSFPATGMVAGQ
jgi:hypothetical protein